jgi:hypothetical protein
VSELGALQHAFGAALASVDGARRNASIFRGDCELVLARLAVYRGNVVGASGKALAGAYPVIGKIVGEEFFEGLAREYLRRHPSASGDLNEFGESFAEFVATFPHTQDLPYLPDVARMEWLAHRAYYAADARPLETERLASMHFALGPACALMQSRWPLARIWEVHQDDFDGEFSVDLDAGPQKILVYRPRFRVLVAALPEPHYRFLEALAGGMPLARETDFDLGSVLAEWIGAGVLVEAHE